jgi:hypothetical protein
MMPTQPLPPIAIADCRYRHVSLQPRRLFRANLNPAYKYQADDAKHVRQGRFNVDGEYCFYVALSPIAALLEFLSYEPDADAVHLHSYVSTRAIELVDLTRFQFPTPPDVPSKDALYSQEEFVVNQYITCPREPASFPWNPEGSRRVAHHYRSAGATGVLYQTSIAHGLHAADAFYGDPKDLLNVALFVEPGAAATLLQHESVSEHRIDPATRERLVESKLDLDTVRRRVLCQSFTESAMVAVGASPWHDDRSVRVLV